MDQAHTCLRPPSRPVSESLRPTDDYRKPSQQYVVTPEQSSCYDFQHVELNVQADSTPSLALTFAQANGLAENHAGSRGERRRPGRARGLGMPGFTEQAVIFLASLGNLSG